MPDKRINFRLAHLDCQASHALPSTPAMAPHTLGARRARFFMAPHTGSPTIFFGTMLLFAEIGAAIPIMFGRETVGQIELVTETVPELA